MNFKEFKKKLRKKIRKGFDNRNKKRLKNRDFSIICQNCIAGIIYNNLDLEFLSPTINMYLEADDYIKLCKKLKYYLNYELKEIKTNNEFPVAQIDDIKIYGVHYKDFSELNEAWIRRSKRVNYNNIFLIMTERDKCSYKDIVEFDRLPYKNKVIFVHKEMPEIKSAFYIKGTEFGYNMNGEMRSPTDYKSRISSKRFLDDFDYVSFFNRERKK